MSVREKPWYGFVEGGRVKWDYEGQFRAFLHKLEGEEIVAEVLKKSEAKTRLQEKGFHAMITPWARERGYEIYDLKRWLLGEIFGYREDCSPLTGERLLVEPSTGKLPKRKYSELIERTLELAMVKDEFYLEAPHEYRERKEREHAAELKRRQRHAA